MAIFAKWLKQANILIVQAALAYLVCIALMLGVAAHASVNQVPETPEPVVDAVDEEATDTVIEADPEEVDLLARVIQAEAATEPYEGKVAVGAVVINRVEHEDFPDTINEVIYEPRAFCTVTNGSIRNPAGAEARRAAQDALAGKDPSRGALYFWNPYKKVNPWVWNRDIITQIDHHIFAR